MENNPTLRPGDSIRVVWGNRGAIEAVVSRINGAGAVYAKRRKRGTRNFTLPRRVYPDTLDGQGWVFALQPPAIKLVMAEPTLRLQ